MDKVTYRITLDTHRSGVQKTLYGFFAGDVLARKIAISLVGGSTPCKYDEVTAAVMYVTKPNGTTSYNACTVSDNTIFYDVLQTDTDTAGIVTMQFKVMSGETVLYAPEFALEVQASKNSDTPAEETPTYTALEEALLKTETVAANEQERVDAEKKRAEEYGAMRQEMQKIIAEADALLTAGGISEEKAQHLIDEATKDKVDKVEGQGLSTNDYSDAEKQQVATNKTNIENLKSGDTPAGDAEKFGGELPEHYAKQTEVDNIVNGTTEVGKAKEAAKASKADSATNSEKLGNKTADEWQTVLDNKAEKTQVNNIINGTTIVGNAAKLTLTDTVTGTVCEVSIEDGIITLREA
ncbi:MAG: hypothetical protein IJ353_04905 [Lachnospiraceae bacterium]|nr:hypothetical protein [Lachnospiraceae bacterium]